MHLKIWEPVIDQALSCIQKPDNVKETNAVAVISEKIAGHVPEILVYAWHCF